jgi:hypothetical protein
VGSQVAVMFKPWLQETYGANTQVRLQILHVVGVHASSLSRVGDLDEVDDNGLSSMQAN